MKRPKTNKQNLKSLFISENKYLELIESMQEGLWVIDKDANTTLVNHRMADMLGYTVAEMQGRNLLACMDEHWIKVAENKLERRQQGIKERHEFEFTRKDGTRIYTSLDTFPLTDDGGNYAGAVAIVEDITQRKQAEQSLQESERYFRALLENSSDIVQVVDSAGVIRYVSPSVQRILGYRPEELIGTLSVAVVHPDDLPKVALGFEEALRNPGLPVITECRCKHKDGTWRVIKGTGSSYLGHPCINGFVSNMHDITERRRAEHELDERVKELQCLYSVANIAERPGVTLDEICKEVVNLIPGGWQYPEITCARITIEGKEFRTKNYGESRWKQFSAIELDGAKIGEIEVCYLEERPEIDEGPFMKEERLLIAAVAQRLARITQRIYAAEALRQSEEKLRTILDNVRDVVFQLSPRGIIQYVSPSVAAIHGYKTGDLVGKHLNRTTPSGELPKVSSIIKRVFSGEIINNVEIDQFDAGGKIIPTEVSCTPVIKDGKIVAVQGIIRDISERKEHEAEIHRRYEAEQELRKELQAEIAKRIEFTHALVHELKTPLTPVLASSEMLSRTVDRAFASRLARNVYDGAMQLSHRIDDLMQLARMEIGPLKVNITLIDLRALIRDTVDYLQPAISQSGQLLNVFLPDSLPLVPADGERLRQVLINLIDNAMKYTPSGSEITVAAREEGIDLIVEVKDNGEGMSGELRERLFQPYSRVRSDRQSLKGLGLGLLIARNIVELHGGKIWVKSNSGAGTTFSFSIPLSAANSASQRETPGP